MWYLWFRVTQWMVIAQYWPATKHIPSVQFAGLWLFMLQEPCPLSGRQVTEGKQFWSTIERSPSDRRRLDIRHFGIGLMSNQLRFEGLRYRGLLLPTGLGNCLWPVLWYIQAIIYTKKSSRLDSPSIISYTLIIDTTKVRLIRRKRWWYL